MLALMHVRSGSDNIPEDVVRSGVVEQIETLFFAVVKLYGPIKSVHGKLERSTGEETHQRCARE